PTVEDILADYDQPETPSESTLSRAALQIEISLNDPKDVLAQAVRERRTFVVTEENALTISPALWAALGTHHFVVTPLIGREKTVGVIVADNLYSSAPITEDSVDLLKAFAGHAALALENASLYGQLQEKIDELEQTQEDLLQAERLAAIGEMSAHISHEIRNPLATIGGFARSLQRSPSPQRVDTAARIIYQEVTRLEDLLTDILNYTRPRILTLSPTNLSNLIEEVYDLVSEGLEERGITYYHETPPALPDVSVDQAQIKQVLINLIKNAFQAMPDGGKLTVYIRPDNHDTTGPQIEIEIRDTGPGIPSEIQNKIFKPYFTTKTTGTGLGLAISQQIIERHKGTLSLESDEGSGTSIFIRLPAQHKKGEPV
ncbi:MAG: ATP-binding protein, partial [Candidatus Latescibacteria bacterium]|nr:ATP-binding protein [Candidatus Latescibacterota bacterium]